jgi:hypothetical protein
MILDRESVHPQTHLYLMIYCDSAVLHISHQCILYPVADRSTLLAEILCAEQERPESGWLQRGLWGRPTATEALGKMEEEERLDMLTTDLPKDLLPWPETTPLCPPSAYQHNAE